MSIFNHDKLRADSNHLERLNYIESILATKGFDIDPNKYYYAYGDKKYPFSVNEFQGSSEFDDDTIVIFFECIPTAKTDIVDVNGKIMVNLWNATNETFDKIDAMIDRITIRNDVLKVMDSFVLKDARMLSDEVKVEIEMFENRLLALLF